MENFLTVVIATIGEPTLNRTIKSLVVSSIVPNQILVCIPKEKQKHLPELDEFGAIIKIIPTEGRDKYCSAQLDSEHQAQNTHFN
jgi:hypothetical protein